MTMTINLLAHDARENNKLEDAKLFVACIAGQIAGAVVAAAVIVLS